MSYVLLILGIIIILCLVYFFIMYNSFVKLDNKVKEAFATMDVYLKKRWDLIPNLVEIVKGHAKYEKETIKEIMEIRNSSYESLSDNDKIKTNEQINRKVSKLLALAESYPELKSNEIFLSLSKELSKIEDEIAQSRKYYNAVARDFNNKVEMFPSNIVARTLSYKEKEMFIAQDNEKDVVKVTLK